MTPPNVTIYAGRFPHVGLSDLTTAPELERQIRVADVLHIHDPLSFPWEWFTRESVRCPVVVDISQCSKDDLVALAPVLSSLTPSDRVFGERSVVASLCERLNLPSLWSDPELDITGFAMSARWSKLADVEERMIVEKLAQDDSLLIRVIGADELHDPRGFAPLVRRLSEELGGAVVDTVWGIHPEPGRPVVRAVLAMRPQTTVRPQATT